MTDGPAMAANASLAETATRPPAAEPELRDQGACLRGSLCRLRPPFEVAPSADEVAEVAEVPTSQSPL